MIRPAFNQVKLPKGVLVDEEDLHKLVGYNTWFISKRGDVYSQKWKKGKATTYKLHRVIMNCPKGKVVDHINHNTLDNRKRNLRICTAKQNSRNLSLSKKNTSGVTGVAWDRIRNKWVARIKVDYREIYLGRFIEKEKAITIRKEAEIKYFGGFANA